MVKQEYQEIIISIIKKYVPKGKIILFGSRARKDHSPGSDIDLAIDTPTEIDLHLIGKIKEEIEEKNVPFFVDIVDLQRADNTLKTQIQKDGILWSN